MANPPPPKMPSPPKKGPAPWRLKLAKVAPWLFWLFVAGGVLQVYLAGYGIENLGDQGMAYHVDFAHALEMLPLLIIILGFLGANWRNGVGGVVLLGLFFVQYFTLEGTYAPVLALHAANGALLIGTAVVFALAGMRWRPAAATPPTPGPAAQPKPMPLRATPTVPGRPPQPPAR